MDLEDRKKKIQDGKREKPKAEFDYKELDYKNIYNEFNYKNCNNKYHTKRIAVKNFQFKYRKFNCKCVTAEVLTMRRSRSVKYNT
jgi:hypothetical protein